MKYYLVALFDKKNYGSLEKLQRKACKRYRIYRGLPTLHITLEVLEDPDVDKLWKVVEKIIKPYKKFKIEVNKDIVLDQQHRCINLGIENKGYIVRLARKINDMLKLHGFKVKASIESKELDMFLANINYNNKEAQQKINNINTNFLKDEKINDAIKIDRIELWKYINNKREVVVKSFPLKSF